MKLAIPHWHGRISPVFDVARQALLVEPSGEGEEIREDLALTVADPIDRAAALAGRGVGRLICGAISQPFRAACAARDIEVMSGICGEVEAVIAAATDGSLTGTAFRLPGCRRRYRGGRGSGPGRSGGCGRGRGPGRGRGFGGRDDNRR